MQCNSNDASVEYLQTILTHAYYNEYLFCCDLTVKYEEERLTKAIALAWKEFRVEDVKVLKEQKAALNYTPTEGSAADMRARLVALEVPSPYRHCHDNTFYFIVLLCSCFGCFHLCCNIVYTTSCESSTHPILLSSSPVF